MNRRVAALGARGRATAQDLLAAIAALWTLAWILTASTGVLSGDLGTIPLIEAIAAPMLVVVVLLIVLAWTLPAGALTLASDRPRWRAPLYLLGVLAAPMIVALHFRRRVDRSTPARWIALPRWVATRVAVAALATIAGEVPILLAHWPRVRVVDHVILWLALACPVVVAAALATRILARRELLRMPATSRAAHAALASALAPTRALAAAAFGLTVAPMIVAHLWLGAEARERARDGAAALAQTLLAESAPGSEDALGALLGAHPGVGVRTADGALYGGAPDPREALLAGEDATTRVFARSAHAVVSVPIRAQSPTSLLPFATLALLCLGVGLAAASTILRQFDRDAARLTWRIRQVHGEAIAGPSTSPPGSSDPRIAMNGAAEGADNSDDPSELPAAIEWRTLGDELGQLRARLDDLEIARYLTAEVASARDQRQIALLAAISGDLQDAVTTLAEVTHDLPGARGLAIAGRIQVLADILDPVADLAALVRAEAELRPRLVPAAVLLSAAIRRARARRPDLRIDLRSAAGLPALHVDLDRHREALTALLLFAGRRLTNEVLLVRVDHDPLRLPAAVRVDVVASRRPASAAEAEIARRPFHGIAGQPHHDQELARADAILGLFGGSLTIMAIGEGMHFTATLPALRRHRRAPLIERQRGGSIA